MCLIFFFYFLLFSLWQIQLWQKLQFVWVLKLLKPIMQMAVQIKMDFVYFAKRPHWMKLWIKICRSICIKFSYHNSAQKVGRWCWFFQRRGSFYFSVFVKTQTVAVNLTILINFLWLQMDALDIGFYCRFILTVSGTVSYNFYQKEIRKYY